MIRLLFSLFKFRPHVALAFVFCVMFSIIAYAQDQAPPLGDMTVPTTGGTVLTWVYIALLALLGFLVARLILFLHQKGQSNALAAFGERLVIKAQAVVANKSGKLDADTRKALEDGVIDAGERATLIADALLMLKDVAAAELGELPSVLKIFGDGPINAYLTGLLERVFSSVKLGGGTPEEPSTPPAGAPAAKNP